MINWTFIILEIKIITFYSITNSFTEIIIIIIPCFTFFIYWNWSLYTFSFFKIKSIFASIASAFFSWKTYITIIIKTCYFICIPILIFLTFFVYIIIIISKFAFFASIFFTYFTIINFTMTLIIHSIISIFT